MTFQDAKKLQIGDSIVLKRTDTPCHITKIEIENKDIFLRCDNGLLYHHKDILLYKKKGD